MRKTNAEYQKAYRLRHPGREAANGHRAYLRARDLVNTLKSVACLDCGVQYPPYVMDFDHVRGKKVHTIGDAMRVRFVLEEAKKCDVVCSNCHRERTHRRKHLQPKGGRK